MNKLWTIVVMASLLVGSAFASFIQRPIPPSSNDNYLFDSDKDGRLDQISIKFLGSISEEYLEQMVDSLTFDWLDSSEKESHERRLAKDMTVSPKVKARIYVDLHDSQHSRLVKTGLGVADSLQVSIGNVRLFLKDGTEYSVTVRDRMAPVIRSALLKVRQKDSGSRSLSRDTLSVVFSESVSLARGCSEFLEYKSAEDDEIYVLSSIDTVWSSDLSSVKVALDGAAARRLQPRDSLRIISDCVKDSLGNATSDSAHFVSVNGFIPLEYESGSMVEFDGDFLDNVPVFELMFKDADSDYPNDGEWGIAMDVLTPEFLTFVRETLELKDYESLELAKLRIKFDVSIYTNLGDFVVAKKAEVRGIDSRFEGGAKRLFLKWNLMDDKRRHVGTGAYISNVAVIVAYGGTVVYRSDVHHGPTTKVFGVKRR